MDLSGQESNPQRLLQCTRHYGLHTFPLRVVMSRKTNGDCSSSLKVLLVVFRGTVVRRVYSHEHSLVYGSSQSHGVAGGIVVQLLRSRSCALCQGNCLLDKMQLLRVQEQKILAEAAANSHNVS